MTGALSTPLRTIPAWPGRDHRALTSSGATFDRLNPGEATYRYLLWREYEKCAHAMDQMTFIMLNPSTADAERDDPTIRRCVDFALRRDYLRIEVVNLFAFRATLPRLLKTVANPTGFANDTHIIGSASRASVVVCAWGAGGSLHNRSAAVRHLLRERQIRMYHFGLTRGGEPRHPLYLKRDTELREWI